MAKQIVFGEYSRRAVLHGINQLADAVKVTPLDVKEGDTILFGKYSGQEIKMDGEEYLIMREEEILGVVTK